MLDDSKDLNAAAKAFLGIFESADRRMRKDAEKAFLKTFANTYQTLRAGRYYTKDKFNETEELERLRLMVSKSIGCPIIEQGRILGQVLGRYLAILETRFASPMSLSTRDTDILNANQRLANELKLIGKKVKLKFIERRMMRIARQTGGLLNKNRQELIARMAAAFV